MNLWEFTRSPASVNVLLDFGRESGIAEEALLRGSRLSAHQLLDPNVEITAAQEVHVIKNLLRLTKADASLGLCIGKRYTPSAYGMWGFGLISSATLGDAISHALRFLPLTYVFSQISSGLENGLLYLRFQEADLEQELKLFSLHRDMAAALTLLKTIMGADFALTSVTLRQPLRRQSSNYQEFTTIFGTEPHFGAPHNALVFDEHWLSRSLPLANPNASLMCAQICNELLEKRRAKLGTTAIVHQYLGLRANHIPNLSEMAGNVPGSGVSY